MCACDAVNTDVVYSVTVNTDAVYSVRDSVNTGVVHSMTLLTLMLCLVCVCVCDSVNTDVVYRVFNHRRACLSCGEISVMSVYCLHRTKLLLTDGNLSFNLMFLLLQ